MSLAHIRRVGTAGLTLTDDSNGRCIKSTKNKGRETKGYDIEEVFEGCCTCNMFPGHAHVDVYMYHQSLFPFEHSRAGTETSSP